MECSIITIGGNVPGGAGRDPTLINGTRRTTDAVAQSIALVDLPVNGANVLFRSFLLSSTLQTPGAEGQGVTIWEITAAKAVRNAFETQLVGRQGGPQWPLVSLGYAPIGIFAVPPPAPLNGDLILVGNQVHVTFTGQGGVTHDWRYVMNIYLDGGAVRLHP